MMGIFPAGLYDVGGELLKSTKFSYKTWAKAKESVL